MPDAEPRPSRWSSARAHLAGRDDGLVRVAPLINRVGRFADLVEAESDGVRFAALRAAEGTGRPLGSADFVAGLKGLSDGAAQAEARTQAGRAD